MADKTSEWRPGPTVCRCCLAEGCYKDISTEYFWMGKREVYAEMLAETFSVSIAYSKSGGPNSNSRLICEPCISRLRDASDFKKQVQECEKTFMQYLDPGSSSTTLESEVQTSSTDKRVKVEQVKIERQFSDDEFDSRDFGDDDDDDDMDQPLTTFASKEPKKETVNLMELLASPQLSVKRKAPAQTKTVSVKKVKVIKKDARGKPTTSKAAQKNEDKKKKGKRDEIQDSESLTQKDESITISKRSGYQRSARAESRIIIKKNATSLLECWSFCPFRWKKNKFKCSYCEDDFTDCEILRGHVRACSKQHNVKDIYRKFREMPMINVDVTRATCNYCTEAFSDVKQMRSHVKEHGFYFNFNQPDGILPFYLDKDWKCLLCDERFNTFLTLYEHMNVHYQHYICATCGKGYMTAPRLRKHSEVHLSGSFPCSECGKQFNMRAARDAHKATAHAKGPRYECPHCSMRFVGYYDRIAHLNEAHMTKVHSYSCTHCDLSFRTSGKRANHMQTVHFPRQYNFGCTFCEWKFKTNYELKRHLVRHSGLRNIQCPFCAKCFRRHRALVSHLKTHNEVDCKWCGTTFKQRSHVLTHMRSAHPELMDLVQVTAIKMPME
ncbi:zinc finger protein draculin-like isoform X6 [Bombyx mori]|uniref:Uncharacterized protein n=1 Tax=Bombyx mori TaxID=7091 RepID=A0A8R2M6Z9_BOMMO|nr:ferritin isoform X5 [Bombyx mori]